MNRIIPFPSEVTELVRITDSLRTQYGRSFRLDGHLVGDLGELIASTAFGLTLLPASKGTHDAVDAEGRHYQIKLTMTGKEVAFRGKTAPDMVIVLRAIDDKSAEVVYHGPGEPVWKECRKPGDNGQRSVLISKIRQIQK
jgi:hypothetical protein